MKTRSLVILLWLAALAVGATGGCKCGKSAGKVPSGGQGDGTGASDESAIPSPTIEFPQRWRAAEVPVNTFIDSALKVAATGDYDGFRQLFSLSYTPPTRQEFQRVWEAVESIVVTGLYGDRPKPEKYYLHAVVNRRQADRKGRHKQDVVLMVYKEADQWRLGPASKEVRDLILAAASSPASGAASAPEGY